jgi:hypothetical protein
MSGRALDVALAYYDAWTSKDLERAMALVADDIVCEAPPGRIEGADAYRNFMGPVRADPRACRPDRRIR